MIVHFIKRSLLAHSRCLQAGLLACLLACLLASPASAAPPPWPESSFTYIASNQKLPEVLLRVARTFGIELALTPAVRSMPVQVNGRITTANPSEFLNQMGAAYGLTWYYQNGTLHVSRSSEQQTQAVVPTGFSPGGLKRALTELGVVENKFGWGEVPDRGMVLVSGPPSYVQMVARTVAELPAAPPDQQVHVFRLRHASAEDRVVSYRDKQITTIGVANILRALITGSLTNRPGMNPSTQLMDLSAPLRAQYTPTFPPPPGSNPTSQAVPQQPLQPQPLPPGVVRVEPGASGAPPSLAAANNVVLRGTIQTDTRLNAIILRDRPENVAIYKQLIELLDVPSDLIEIEAMIVDVSLSKVQDLGVDWSVRRGSVSAGFGAAGAVAAIASGGATAVIGDTAASLLARIRALETDGNARVISRPSILTIDNLGALIDLSETFYIQAGGDAFYAPGLASVSVGVTLKVTPRVIADAQGTKAVQLVVDIEDGAIQENRVGILPTVRRTTIGTQAVIGERESLLVGGFNSSKENSRRDSVPGLSSVPVFGGLFSRNTVTESRMERLFLITPRIVATPVR